MQTALADYYGSIGFEKLQSKDYASSDLLLTKSILLSGSNAEHLVNHGQAMYALAGRASEGETVLDLLRRAEHSFAEAARINPREGNGWFGLAQTCWWLSAFSGYEKRVEKAGPCFERALQTDPGNGKFLYALIDFNLSTRGGQGQSDKLVESLATAHPEAWSGLRGHPRFSAVLRDRFVQGLERAAANPLTDCSALKVLADMSAEAGEWDRAAIRAGQLVERAEQRNTVSHQSYLDLGQYLMKAGKLPESKKAYLRGMMLSKNRIQALNSILPAFQGARLPDMYLDIAVAASSFDAGVVASLPIIRGKVALDISGDLEYAAECFKLALEKRESAAPHRYLAEIAMRKQDWDRAELESHRAIMLAPRDAELHYLFARSLEEQKRYMAALDAVGQAIKHSPTPMEGHFIMRGRLFEAIGNYASAIQAWEAARRLNPKNAHPIRQIAHGYKNLGDLVSARNYYITALTLFPGDEVTIRELEAVRAQMRPNTAKKQSATVKR
ncbi:MAG: tetratricopeptide repeat protein [Desulfobacteraceae bacterium]|nr:tetratricopeptide repeat protein [Desulfobacteraceae bacterium]